MLSRSSVYGASIEINETKRSGYQTFTVNETTGEILTLNTIDYELKTLYSVVIEAKDNGTTSLSSRCLVKVVINDPF